MADEKMIRMAAGLYSMRDTARQLLGANYPAKMAELGAVLQKVAAQTNREPLAVALDASKGADATSVCFFLAACVELSEPTATAQHAPTAPTGSAPPMAAAHTGSAPAAPIDAAGEHTQQAKGLAE